MNKALALAVLLLGTFAIGFATNQSAPTTFLGPRVVAKVALAGQTAPIPETKLFTVPVTGIYRVSYYMTSLTGATNNPWYMALDWSDDSGPEQIYLAYLFGSNGGTQNYAFSGAGDAPTGITISAVAGSTIDYQVFGPGATGTYEVYLIVERLA